MNRALFFKSLILIALGFTLFFVFTVVPPMSEDWNVIGAFAAGFVNPYAAGYSTDVIMCWCVLAVWVIYERKQLHVRGGWICVLLGVVPGVAVGFALYCYLRSTQVREQPVRVTDLP